MKQPVKSTPSDETIYFYQWLQMNYYLLFLLNYFTYLILIFLSIQSIYSLGQDSRVTGRKARARDSTGGGLSSIPSNSQENCGYSRASTTARRVGLQDKFDVVALLPCLIVSIVLISRVGYHRSQRQRYRLKSKFAKVCNNIDFWRNLSSTHTSIDARYFYILWMNVLFLHDALTWEITKSTSAS